MVTFRANIYGPLHRGMVILSTTTLLLEVFTQINFVADFIRLKLIEFYFLKTTKRFFGHPLGGLTGNVCTSSIARWKARSRFPIRHCSVSSSSAANPHLFAPSRIVNTYSLYW